MLRNILPEVTRNIDFQKLWWAQILSQLAFNTLLYTLIIRIAEKTSSNTAISFFILSFSIPALIFSLLAGVWVDRLDRRKVLIATNLVRTALIPLFYLAETAGFALIYPLVILISIVTQFFLPAEASKLTSLVPHKILHQANSLFTFTLYVAIIAGPVLAGPLLKVVGVGRIFIILTVLFGMATILTMLLPKDSGDRETPTEERKLHADLLAAFRHIWGDMRVRGGILLLAFSQTIIQILSAVAPGYTRSVLGVDVTDTSLVMLAPAALGMIVGALLLSRFGHRFSRRQLVVTGVFLAGAVLIVIGAVQGIAVILPALSIVSVAVIFLFILGAANALLDVPSNTAVQIHTPEELRGRVYGVLQTLVNGASFLPVLFAGVMADIFSVPVLIIVMGLSVFLIGFYILEKARTL